MTKELNRTALNFNVDITDDELIRIKKLKEEYKIPAGSYIRAIMYNLLDKIGPELKNFEQFFPDESGRKGYSFGEIHIGKKSVELINRIKQEKGTSRKDLLRTALDLALKSKELCPENVNQLFKVDCKVERKPKTKKYKSSIP